MPRGDVVTVAARGGFGGKPRPAVVVQSDAFAQTASVTLCLFTSVPTEADLARVPIEPSTRNGLRAASWVMADKIITVPRETIGVKIGTLTSVEIEAVETAILLFRGLVK